MGASGGVGACRRNEKTRLHLRKVLPVMELQRERLARGGGEEANKREEEIHEEQPPRNRVHSAEL